MDKYHRLHKEGRAIYEIDKSKFIALGKAVKTEEEALEYIEGIKEDYQGANHYVYSYVLGEQGLIQRFNDDGEPSGTAGKPILDLLKHEEVVDSVIVIVRFFGGIKLGAGGLIRAYSKSARMLIENVGVATMERHVQIKIPFHYHLWGKGENILRQQEGFYVSRIDYSETIDVVGYVHPRFMEHLERTLMDLSSGNIAIDRLGERYLEIYNGKVYLEKEEE